MLLVVKFRNQLHRLNPALQVDMKNIRSDALPPSDRMTVMWWGLLAQCL